MEQRRGDLRVNFTDVLQRFSVAFRDTISTLLNDGRTDGACEPLGIRKHWSSALCNLKVQYVDRKFKKRQEVKELCTRCSVLDTRDPMFI